MKTFQQFQEETPDIKGIITRSGKKPLKKLQFHATLYDTISLVLILSIPEF